MCGENVEIYKYNGRLRYGTAEVMMAVVIMALIAMRTMAPAAVMITKRSREYETLGRTFFKSAG